MTKKLQLSHSSISKYQTCGQMYKYHYVDKLRPTGIGSALLFGKAIDYAIEKELKGEDGIKEFELKWRYQEVDGKLEDLITLDSIQYLKSDLDLELLSSEDFDFLNEYKPINVSGIEESLKLVKQSEFRKVSDDVIAHVNVAYWLSLRVKGKLMLEAFKTNLKPRIKEVIATQKKIELTNSNGDSVIGYVDLIAKLDDDTVAVLDIKTSGKEYEVDSVEKSVQLALYSYAIADEIPHSKCGFMVLIKKPVKEYSKVCESCGAENESTHKSCPVILPGGKKCGGSFKTDVSFYGESQLLLDTINERTKQMIVDNFDMASRAISSGIYIRNFTACKSIFGQECPYMGKCFKDSCEGLVQHSTDKSS